MHIKMETLFCVGTLDYKTFKGSYGIHVVRMDGEKGSLTHVSERNNGYNPSFLISNKTGTGIYTVSERLEDGALTFYHLNGEELLFKSALNLPGEGCVHAQMSPDQRFILVACWKTANVIVCSLDSKGVPTEVVCNVRMPDGHGPLERQTQPNPHQVVFDPSGRWVAIPDLGADRLHLASYEPISGELTLRHRANVAPGGGPRHLVFHPTNGCLYLFTEMDTAIYVFGFDQQSGELSFKQKTCLLPKALLERAEIQGAEIQISPDGKYVFASVRGYYRNGQDQIFRLTINEHDGSVHSPVCFPCGGKCPRMFEFTPDHRFIIVCNQADHEVVSLEYEEKHGTIGKVCGRVHVPEAAAVTSAVITNP